jgi:gamma-glutamylcysteine synthetase
MNWGNVVKEGRNPNLKLLKNKEKVSIKDSGMAVIDSLRNIFEQMPPEMNEYTKKVFKSIRSARRKV